MDGRLQQLGVQQPPTTCFPPRLVQLVAEDGQPWTAAASVSMGDTCRTGSLAAPVSYPILQRTVAEGQERVVEQPLAEWAYRTAAECRGDDATVVVLITDNRPMSQISHLQHTGPLWSDRTRCVGPAQERWKVVWCDLGLVGLGRVRFTWGVVFAAEALSAALPKVTLVLADHDSAFQDGAATKTGSLHEGS